MRKMDKKERIRAALTGKPVDRVPFSFWYHFGLQHSPGKDHARAELDFYKAYDLDFLKVMNDYPFPLPQGMDLIRNKDDWYRVSHETFTQQLKALKLIGSKLSKEAYFIETIFSPWSIAHKMCREKIIKFMKESPEALLYGLEVITQSFECYLQEVLAETELSGIFLSIGGASYDFMTEKEYARFGRPFDLRILKIMKKAPLNVLHLHGNRLHFKAMADYPVQAINWSHRHTPPTLKKARELYPGCLIAGVDEHNTDQLFPSAIRKQVRETIQQAGERKLIIGPGCAVPTQTPVANLMALREGINDYYSK